ncbi:isochorismatase family protein [Xylaria sp. FL1042]|nr:isochorismatase family protein [Xylaria sp. FL1042]
MIDIDIRARDAHEDQNSTDPVVLGNSKNSWTWNAETGFDLTHPATPTAEAVVPRIELEAYNAKITIAPHKTTLVIVDLQNLLALEPPNVNTHVEETILRYAVPAARKADIQADLDNLNPATDRIHPFHADGSCQLDKGSGHDMGLQKTFGGEEVQAGRFLMQDQWNTWLHGLSEAAYQEGLRTSIPDRLFYKNRISVMCQTKTDCTDFLVQAGIKTLLFAGCNTDVCVMGTLQDASLKNFDCILLADGTATTNGKRAQWATERNCRKGWGFVSYCTALSDGVANMKVSNPLADFTSPSGCNETE